MTRSFIYLRRALLGVSCTIVFGVGAAEAYARETWVTISWTCNPRIRDSAEFCADRCAEAGYQLDSRCAYASGGWCECQTS